MKLTLPIPVCAFIAGAAFYGQAIHANTASATIDTPLSAVGDSITASADSASVKTATLNEVVIEAERVIKRGNTMLLFPSKRDKRFAAGGIDVLSNMNIPDVIVNPITKEATSAGGETISMFIDFLPASAQQIREIRPQDIERIDIIHSPDDPRFQNARVVANYIMKKYLYGGYTKVDGTQKFMPYYGNYGLYSKFSYKKMTYDLSAGTSYFNSGNESKGESISEYRFASGTIERKSATESMKSRNIMPRVSGRAVYNSNGISIANSIGFNYSRQKPFEQTSIVDFSDIFDSSRSHSNGNTVNKGASWNGNYWFALPANSSLSFNGSFSWADNTNNSTYRLADYAPIINDISEQALNTYGTFTYTKRIGAHSVSGIAAGGWSRNKLDYNSSDDTGVHYREGFGQIGASAHLSFGRFMISPSIRISLSSQKINNRSLTDWYPKTFIPFYIQLSRVQSLNGSFEFAMGRPDASFLSPVLLRNNEIDAVRGNENLSDYDFYSAGLGYSHYFGPWLRARFDAKFQHFKNDIVPIYSEEISESGTPMMVRDVVSDGSYSNTTLSLNLSGEYFQRRLTVALSAGARYFAQRGLTRRDKWEPHFWISASYYLGNFRINAYFTPSSKSYSTWYDIKTPAYFYIGGSWSWKDLFIDVQFSIPFRKSHIALWKDFNSAAYSFRSISRSPGYHQLANITVSWSFSYGKKLNRDDEVGKLGEAKSIILK